MADLDIFKGSDFTVRSLSTAIMKLPYKPQKIGQMNLFRKVPETSQYFGVEEEN